MFSQCYVVEKIFQNLRVRLKLSIREAMKIKLFVTWEIQYSELGIFSFNSYVYYLGRGFITSARAFNLPTRAFSHAARAFSLLTRGFEFVTRGFELVTRGLELLTRGFELVTCGFELVTPGFELVTRASELVTRNSCFTFPHVMSVGVWLSKISFQSFQIFWTRIPYCWFKN